MVMVPEYSNVDYSHNYGPKLPYYASSERYRAERRAMLHNMVIADRLGTLRVLAQWAELMRVKPEGWQAQAREFDWLIRLAESHPRPLTSDFFLAD
jgi:hypothetical protein